MNAYTRLAAYTALCILSHALNAGSGSIFIAGNQEIEGLALETVWEVDPVSGELTVVTTGGLLESIDSIAVAPNGDILVTSESPGNGAFPKKLIRIDASTKAQSTLVPDGQSAFQVATTPGGSIYIGGYQNLDGNSLEAIWEVDRVSGELAVVSAGGLLESINSIAVAPNGDILVTSESPGNGEFPKRLIRIDASTRAQSILVPEGQSAFKVATRLGPPPELRLVPPKGLERNWKFTALAGKTNYIVQQSGDLNGWTNLMLLNSTNAFIEFSLPINDDFPNWFLKVFSP